MFYEDLKVNTRTKEFLILASSRTSLMTFVLNHLFMVVSCMYYSLPPWHSVSKAQHRALATRNSILLHNNEFVFSSQTEEIACSHTNASIFLLVTS